MIITNERWLMNILKDYTAMDKHAKETLITRLESLIKDAKEQKETLAGYTARYGSLLNEKINQINKLERELELVKSMKMKEDEDEE